MGFIVLQGGAEFGGRMRICDLAALNLAGGFETRLSIIPAAAAPDNNHDRAGQNGRNWFESLGARNIRVLPLVDRISADDPRTASHLRGSGLIYLLGGFPGYLFQTLQGSLSWQAVQTALDGGAVLAGSSAGAMVLCDHFFDPVQKAVQKGFGLVRGACLLPHFNTFGRQWANTLQKQLPRVTLIGIDEQTGMINDGPLQSWSVHGSGMVTLIRQNHEVAYSSGRPFTL
jgi:cyanophycinase